MKIYSFQLNERKVDLHLIETVTAITLSFIMIATRYMLIFGACVCSSLLSLTQADDAVSLVNILVNNQSGAQSTSSTSLDISEEQSAGENDGASLPNTQYNNSVTTGSGLVSIKYGIYLLVGSFVLFV